MTTQLLLYNGALREIGAEKLSSTSEAHERRYVLDDAYPPVLAECLEAGQWNFAIRAVRIDADATIEPNFGFSRVFDKPADWVRTVGLCADEFYATPLTDRQYSDEVGVWLADIDPLYVRYISSGASYGGNLNAWPASFARLVELSLADRICERLTQNASKKQVLQRDVKLARREALNRDAMNEGTRVFPSGAWVAARNGRSRRDRGSRSNLTG